MMAGTEPGSAPAGRMTSMAIWSSTPLPSWSMPGCAMNTRSRMAAV
jgi:hypothetical protein